MTTTEGTSAPNPGTLILIIIGVSSVSALAVLAVLICVCLYWRKRKDSLDVPMSTATRQRSNENPYTETETNIQVKVEMPEMISEYQHPVDVISYVDGYSDDNYASVEVGPGTSTAGQTGSTGGTKVKDGTTVDAMYSKVKKTKKTRTSNDLYSKPNKTKKDQNFAGNRKDGKRGTGSSQQTNEGRNGSIDDLYTKSSKQKRSKSKSETVEDMYTKPKKKAKKKTELADYENCRQVQKHNEEYKKSDDRQRAKDLNNLADNALYTP